MLTVRESIELNQVAQNILLAKGASNIHKLRSLPPRELPTSFVLPVTLLGIADARRRATDCASGCSHWWHRDLGDPNVVEAIANQD